MNTIRAAVAVLTCTAACAGASYAKPSPKAPESGGDTSHRSFIGAGTAAVTALRKTIAARVVGEAKGLEITSAFALRASVQSSSPYLALKVRNTTATPACFVRLVGCTAKTKSGESLFVDPETSVIGDVLDVGTSSARLTNTCLKPGAWGYALDLHTTKDGAAYERISALECSAFDARFGPFKDAAPHIAVTSHETRANTLRLSFRNAGKRAAIVNGPPVYVLIDERGEPLLWGFADRVLPGANIAPGASGWAESDSAIEYEGSAADALLFVDFAQGG